MALRQIVQIGEPVLRKKSKKVEKIDEKIIQLLDDMAETMYDADGVGLAAPQVGILKRVVVIDIGEELIELINPEIIETSGEQIDEEGCLSVVGEAGNVRRPNYAKVRALNRNGETIELEGEELLARAFCHEIDHLDGILFVDKIEK
ncbi:TPA: peptide deformylase [Clostridioides difficile]|uniref:peptide deformylase n=1 Tax=Clostridioides difficile TaxID=1496 RepID=UPI000EA93EEF|nr:peptide deformylase [Clostridioides difficile]MCJ0128997.1 peptide deformylase [Clostridioides difficile]MDB2991350.1 peptide deformylase [Clostridioides difficile]RKM68162.1 peptide deformylase [Clostridioides difficile]RKM69974.1 peptide deformylase [Clostridioides difficile]VHS61213.1 peptide deformylase 2 (PDF 2) (Polypeptide deformylase 2) [Clostridioides difficile]